MCESDCRSEVIIGVEPKAEWVPASSCLEGSCLEAEKVGSSVAQLRARDRHWPRGLITLRQTWVFGQARE